MTQTLIKPPGNTDLAGVDPELIEAAKRFAEARKSPCTRAAYTREWRAFEAWVTSQGVRALPASPQVVALYLTHMACAGGRKASGIDLALVAISQAHRLAGFESPRTHPVVQEVRGGLRRTLGTAVNQKAPAMVEDLRSMVEALPASLIGQRDRALLLIGFAGGFRRSELAALKLADVAEVPEGLRVHLRWSKTDQEGEGRAVGLPRGRSSATCPVGALREWLEASKIDVGPVFRPVDRHGNVRASALTGRSIARIVKRAAEGAGLDATRYSGHSLRAGLATSAARAGASERAIAKQTGHRSLAVLRGYIREGEIFRENAVATIGL